MRPRYLGVLSLLVLSWFFFAIPQLFPSWLVPPQMRLTTAQALAPPTLTYKISLLLPTAFGPNGVYEVGEGLAIAALVLALPLSKVRLSLPRSRIGIPLGVIGLSAFILFATVDYSYSPLTASWTNPSVEALWNNVRPSFHDSLGVLGAGSALLFALGFAVWKGLKAGIVSGLILLSCFEVGLLFSSQSSEMSDHVTYFANWATHYRGYDWTYYAGMWDGHVVKLTYWLVSNWTVFVFCLPLAIYGGIASWKERRPSS